MSEAQGVPAGGSGLSGDEEAQCHSNSIQVQRKNFLSSPDGNKIQDAALSCIYPTLASSSPKWTFLELAPSWVVKPSLVHHVWLSSFHAPLGLRGINSPVSCLKETLSLAGCSGPKSWFPVLCPSHKHFFFQSKQI